MGRAGRGSEERVTHRPWAVLLLLTVVAGIIYSNTFAVPFILDDTDNIVENAQIHDLSIFRDLSSTRYVGYLSFGLNYHFGGLDVFGYHLVNLLIHIANGYLVYWLVVLLCRACTPLLCKEGPGEVDPALHRTAPWIALIAALLFVAHPIQTQAVTYIVQRLASLVTLWYLLAVVCYLKWRLHPLPSPSRWRGKCWYIAALASTLLAMKTKENSFTIPLMILLVEVTFFRPITKRRWLALGPFLLTLLILPVSNASSLGESEGFARDDTPMPRSIYLFTQFRVIVTYLRLLVFPINQNLDYDYPIYNSLAHPEVFCAFLVLASLFGFALYCAFRPRLRLFGFGIGWFFLALSIESSIIPIKDVIFEHRLYLPSVGFFLAASWLISRRAEGRNGAKAPLIALVCCMVAFLSVATYRRNLVWADVVTLWQDVVRKAPGNARGHSNLGAALVGRGQIEESIREFETAIALSPSYHQAHNNLGSSFLAQGRLDEAVKAFQTAAALKPDFPEARYDLGLAYAKQGRTDDAIREYLAALDLKPGYLKARNNLGAIYAKRGRLPEAAREFEEVLKRHPDNADAHNNVGNVYLLQGRVEEAIRHYEEALRLRPDFREARANRDKAFTERAGGPTP